MRSYSLLCLLIFCKIVSTRDYYAGVFKSNDFLVAQDHLYKRKVSYRTTYAKYGRLFKCPITYFRVVDRLGMGKGPRVEVVRGGLKQKELVLRLTSPYNLPISVNVYVGCENKNRQRIIIKTTPVIDLSFEDDNEITMKTERTTENGTTVANENTTEGATIVDNATVTAEPTVAATTTVKAKR